MSTASRDSVARLLVRVSSNQQPHLRRHCPRCATERRFASSGKFRVNAQKKSLDAWLIFLCTECDTRWNLPIHERRNVKAIDPTELDALMRNDASLAAHYAAASSSSSDVAVDFESATPITSEPSAIELTIAVGPSCWIRLDRLLARVLRLPREDIQLLANDTVLSITPQSKKALRRPATDGQQVRLDLAGCSTDLKLRLAANTRARDRPG